MVDKNYTKIPLDRVDEIRKGINEELKVLSKQTGTRYSTRTFYLGPRGHGYCPKFGSFTRRGQTLKSMATAAKIGIYKDINGWPNLIGYVYGGEHA